jgi:phage-related protein
MYRWRDYETASGHRPIRDFLASLPSDDAARVVAAMRVVRLEGLSAARHLRGDVYEVRAEGDRQSFRVLFSAEGRGGHVLLALHAFSKKTQKTPDKLIRLAEKRLADWRCRGLARFRSCSGSRRD